MKELLGTRHLFFCSGFILLNKADFTKDFTLWNKHRTLPEGKLQVGDKDKFPAVLGEWAQFTLSLNFLMRNQLILIPCVLWYAKLPKAQDLKQTHIFWSHICFMVARMCCRTGCLLLVPHNSFYSPCSLEMVRSTLVWDSLWKEAEKYANWSACLCFAQAEEVPQQMRHSMNFQLCARKIVVNLISEGAITESYLSVWKERVGRKHLVILNNLKVELRQKEECSTALPLDISIDFFSVISINWGCLLSFICAITSDMTQEMACKAAHSLSWILSECSLIEKSLQIPHPNTRGLWCWKKALPSCL